MRTSPVRQMAAEVMRRVLRGLPGLRNAMLLGMATFLSRIPDDYPEVDYPAAPLLIQCCFSFTPDACSPVTTTLFCHLILSVFPNTFKGYILQRLLHACHDSLQGRQTSIWGQGGTPKGC